jgi:hypothetical protein
VNEARDRAVTAVALFENDSGRASVGELCAVGGIGEKSDGVGACARQRADTSDDAIGGAMELTAKSCCELS